MIIEKGRYYKVLVDGLRAYHGSVEDVTEQFENRQHIFPTWKEFEMWFEDNEIADTEITTTKVYKFFRDRVQPLEIGREYEFVGYHGRVGRVEFLGYSDKYKDVWPHIRPIQDPKQELIERLKAVDDPTGAVADAIKALEGEK